MPTADDRWPTIPRLPPCISPVFRWQGRLWSILSRTNQSATFYDVEAPAEHSPSATLYADAFNQHGHAFLLSNGHLGLWWMTLAGDGASWVIIDPSFRIVANSGARGRSTLGAVMVAGKPTLLLHDGVWHQNDGTPAACWHDFWLAQGNSDGTVSHSGTLHLPAGNSTCTVHPPKAGLAIDADGKLVANVVRDSNGRLDLLLIESGTLALLATKLSWAGVYGEYPEVRAVSRPGGWVVATNAAVEFGNPGAPFRLASHPTVFLCRRPSEAPIEVRNLADWSANNSKIYLALNQYGEPLVAQTVYDPATGQKSSVVKLWRVRGTDWQLLFSDRCVSGNMSLRGLLVESNIIYLAYLRQDGQSVVQVSDEGTDPPPAPAPVPQPAPEPAPEPAPAPAPAPTTPPPTKGKGKKRR